MVVEHIGYYLRGLSFFFPLSVEGRFIPLPDGIVCEHKDSQGMG